MKPVIKPDHRDQLLRYAKLVLPSTLALSLVACGAMPLRIVHKHPHHRPPADVCPYRPLTIGTISGGNYHADKGVGPMHPGYTVAVPQSVMLAGQSCRPIEDGEKASGRYVILGPTKTDRTRYRVTVGAFTQQDRPFFSFSEKMVAKSVQRMVNHYQAPVTKLYEKYYVYHGHSTRFAVYQQQLSGLGGSGAMAKRGETLTQIVYVIKQYHHYALFWVTASSCSQHNWINGSNRMSVIQHRWRPMRSMLDSFRIPTYGADHAVVPKPVMINHPPVVVPPPKVVASSPPVPLHSRAHSDMPPPPPIRVGDQTPGTVHLN